MAWLKYFHTGRRQQVLVNGEQSDATEEHLLPVRLYADDVILYTSINSSEGFSYSGKMGK